MSERRHPAIERMTDDQLTAAMDRAARKIACNEEMAAIWKEIRFREVNGKAWIKGELVMTERLKQRIYGG